MKGNSTATYIKLGVGVAVAALLYAKRDDISAAVSNAFASLKGTGSASSAALASNGGTILPAVSYAAPAAASVAAPVPVSVTPATGLAPAAAAAALVAAGASAPNPPVRSNTAKRATTVVTRTVAADGSVKTSAARVPVAQLRKVVRNNVIAFPTRAAVRKVTA